MPTVTARLDAGMSGNDVLARVEAQTAKLAEVGRLVAQLSKSPPSDVGALLRVFGDLPLPKFSFAGDLSAKLIAMRGAVPSDLSGLLGGVLGGLGSLEADFGGALGAQLSTALVAIERLHALTRVDLRCLGGGSGSGTAFTAGSISTSISISNSPPPLAAAAAGGGSNVGAGATNTVARANAILDTLPQPAGIEGVLRWVHGGTDVPREQPFLPAVVPVLDDLRDPVDSLIRWDAMTAAELGVELTASLRDTASFVRAGADDVFGPLAADIDAIANALPRADLDRIADTLRARLDAIGAAVRAGSLSGMSGVAAEVHTLLDEYDALRATLPATLQSDVARLKPRLGSVGADLHASFCHVVSILRPGGAVLINLPAGLELGPIEDLRVWLTGIGDWVEDVLGALDLEALKDPIAEIASGARDIADALDEAVATLVVEVRGVFGELQSLIDAVDTAAIAAAVEGVITQFRAQVVQRVTQALAPARAAIEQAVGALDAAVGAFDPADVVDALQDAIDRVTGVLQDPEVAGVIAQVQEALAGVTARIESLSFTPITDEVIGLIDELTGKVEAIDADQLPDPAKAALAAAALVLPTDLEPITGPIVVDFDGLIERGPVTLVARIEAEPAKLLAQVTRFEPARLLGDTLTKPFDALLRDLEAFRPSKLLKPLAKELDAFKTTLLRAGAPSRALQPLAGPFGELTNAVAKLDPQQLTKPIEDALAQTTGRLMSVLPVDDLFDAIDAVLGAVRGLLDTNEGVVALLRRIHDLIHALAGAPADLAAWVDEVLDKVEQVPDAAAVNAAVLALRDAVDASRAAAIATRFDASTAAARTTLDDIDGGSRLAALITAFHAVSRPALLALPASATRTSIFDALDRFDPIAPSFGAPYRAAGELRAAVNGARATLGADQATWDAHFHFDGSTLTSLRLDAATPAELRAFVDELLDQQLVQPFNALFTFLEPVLAALDTILDGVEGLLARVRARADALLLGPDSVQGLRDALGEIVDDVTDLDLGFLDESLGALFAQLRAKLDALSPATLGKPLDAAFKAVLDTLDIESVLPKAQLQALDASYLAFVAKLRPLDPGKLVIDAVQPVWDETVLPLLAAFDLTPLFESLIEKLRSLDDDLKIELARVSDSFRKLLAAIPAGDLSANVSVGVSL